MAAVGPKRRLDLHLPDFANHGHISFIESREIGNQFVAARSKVVETKLRFCLQSGAVRTFDHDRINGILLAMRERQIGRQGRVAIAFRTAKHRRIFGVAVRDLLETADSSIGHRSPDLRDVRADCDGGSSETDSDRSQRSRDDQRILLLV